MPLNDHPLPLAASARAVADARHWVAQAFREMGREDLVEAAELGTSELVTNALLHAEPPFSLQVRGTREHPRIEVADGSPKPPHLREVTPVESLDDLDGLTDEFDLDPLDLDAMLNTFGRGLNMVAMASVAWGASLESDSKVVWFEPSAQIGEGSGPDPIMLTRHPAGEDPAPVPDGRPVHLLGVDPVLFAAQKRQYFNLRRELRLLALAHEAEYPLARELGEMFASFEQHFPADMFTDFDTPELPPERALDLALTMSPQAADVCATMLEMFELADAFCRAQRLLSLARTPPIREFHHWLLGQVIEQLDGAEPRPWTSTASTASTAHVG